MCQQNVATVSYLTRVLKNLQKLSNIIASWERNLAMFLVALHTVTVASPKPTITNTQTVYGSGFNWRGTRHTQITANYL
jgi:hypothetical protein